MMISVVWCCIQTTVQSRCCFLWNLVQAAWGTSRAGYRGYKTKLAREICKPNRSRPLRNIGDLNTKALSRDRFFLFALHVWLFSERWKGRWDRVQQNAGARPFEAAGQKSSVRLFQSLGNQCRVQSWTSLQSRYCVCWCHAGWCLWQRVKTLLKKLFHMGTSLTGDTTGALEHWLSELNPMLWCFSFAFSFCLECGDFHGALWRRSRTRSHERCGGWVSIRTFDFTVWHEWKIIGTPLSQCFP